MKNFCKLNFFKNPLNDNFILPELTEENYRKQNWYLWIYHDSAEIFNNEILSWAKDKKIVLSSSYVFCGPPNQTSIIHVDGPGRRAQFGINWVLSGHDSSMVWYKPNAIEKPSMINDVGTPYRTWNVEECQEIERHTLEGPTLINADVPHNIINRSNEHRWCVSLRIDMPIDTWAEAVYFYNPYIAT